MHTLARITLVITITLCATTAHAQRQLDRADRVYFWSSVALNQASTAFDGYTTIRMQRFGYIEQGFPTGSSQLYGVHPTIHRYVFVDEALNAAEMYAGWHLMHSHHSWLRWGGRALIQQQTFAHFCGASHNLQLPLY
jgi:hypothetical protein